MPPGVVNWSGVASKGSTQRSRFPRPPRNPGPSCTRSSTGCPAPFRAAVVLCDLEGHTYERAAELLHCPVGTLQSRLSRGRERLRRRLERRGLSSAVAMIGGTGLAARSATAAISPQLVASIARAAAGMARGPSVVGGASGMVTTLVKTEIRRRIVTRSLTTLAVLVLTCLSATALIGMAAVGRNEDPKPQVVEDPRKTDAGPIHVRVVDVQGEGASGIAIEIRAWEYPPRIIQTNTEGRVAIPRDMIGDGAVLLAWRDRESLAWADLSDAFPNTPAGTITDPVTMKLLPLTHRVEGSVADEQGKPIAEVKIGVSSLPYPIQGPIHVMVGTPELPLASASTDDAGRFALMLPEGVGAGLGVSHPRYIGTGTGAKADSWTLDPLILEPAGGILGRVTDATGKPVTGAIVGAEFIEHRVRIRGGGGYDTSDEQGRFLVGGLEPGVYNLVLERMPGREGATARAVEGLRVRAGADTPADLTIIEGRPLRGVVIDRENGQPVAAIHVACQGPAFPRSASRVESKKTDDLGRFTFYVPPGEQHVYVQDGISFGRLSRRDLIVPEEGEIEPIRLMRGKSALNPMMGMTKAAAEPTKAVQEAKPVVKVEVEKQPARVAPLKAPEKQVAAAPEVRTVTGHVRDPQGRPLFAVQIQVSSARGPVPRAPAVRYRSHRPRRDVLAPESASPSARTLP